MNNDYIEVEFICKPLIEDEMDILAAFLCDYGYDSFVNTKTGMKAYINQNMFNESDIAAIKTFYNFSSKITWTYKVIKGADWNEEWEKNSFQPIVIGEQCVVHATYHTDFPKCKYEILIDPKMSFGSGHHETTSMMIEALLGTDMSGKKVIDMGAGTGILSILSAKLGAKQVTGIEIDNGACKNAIDNVKLNGVCAEMINGDASKLSEIGKCDLFLANINRNIILNDIDKYAGAMNAGCLLYISGFYAQDVDILKESLMKYGLELVSTKTRNDWTMAIFHLK